MTSNIPLLSAASGFPADLGATPSLSAGAGFAGLLAALTQTAAPATAGAGVPAAAGGGAPPADPAPGTVPGAVPVTLVVTPAPPSGIAQVATTAAVAEAAPQPAKAGVDHGKPAKAGERLDGKTRAAVQSTTLDAAAPLPLGVPPPAVPAGPAAVMPQAPARTGQGRVDATVQRGAALDLSRPAPGPVPAPAGDVAATAIPAPDAAAVAPDRLVAAAVPTLAPGLAVTEGKSVTATTAVAIPDMAASPAAGQVARVPVASATATASATAATAPASAAHQLAPALIQLSSGPSGSAVTLRLDPAGLGHVQVRIERDASGAATVQVTAEHPETLRLLLADQPQLHRALDSAGLPGQGRSLDFTLAPPDAGFAANAGGGGTSDGGGASRQPGRGSRGPGLGTMAQDDVAFSVQSAWQRAGVDITA